MAGGTLRSKRFSGDASSGKDSGSVRCFDHLLRVKGGIKGLRLTKGTSPNRRSEVSRSKKNHIGGRGGGLDGTWDLSGLGP